MAEAGIKIAENELAYVLTKISPQRLAWSLATSNEEGAELYSKILEQLGENLGFLLVTLNANSLKEFDYQEKVLKRIVTETGGKSLPLIEDSVIEGEMLWHRIRASDTSRGEFRPAGGNTASHGVGETFDFALSFIKPRAEVERPYAEKGLIMDPADDSSWGEISEYGHMAHLGNIYVFDSCDPEARKAVSELSEKANRIPLEKFKLPITGMGSEAHNMLGPQQGNYHLLQRKIKEMIDPVKYNLTKECLKGYTLVN